MADQSTQSIVVDAPAADVMAVIADFDAYPAWVAAAKRVEVVETGADGRAQQVHFVLDAGAVKDDYVLDYTWEGDRRVSWRLVKGQMQKRQEGSYTLVESGGAHRGHVRHHDRPLHPDARDDQAQGREGHPRHRAQGAQEARRGLTRRDHRPRHRSRRGRHLHRVGGRSPSGPPVPAAARCCSPAAPRRSRRSPGLRVVPVDAQRAFEGLWGAAGPALSAAVPDLPVPPASSVVAPPGAADLALLAAIAEAGDSADVVVVDAGPLESALALLALPAALRWWLDQVLPTRLRMLGAVRTAAVRTGAVRSGPVDAVLSAVPVVERLLSRVTLADAAATELRLVAEPRQAAVAAVRDALPVLALHGQRPAVLYARVLPTGGTGEWWAARAAEQDSALAELAALVPVAPVPERPTAPAGADELAALLADDPASPAPPVPVPAPVRVAGGWRLAVPLPFARKRRARADPVGRRPRGHRGGRAPVAAAGRPAAPLRGDRRVARRRRDRRGAAGDRLRTRSAAVAGRPAGRRGEHRMTTGRRLAGPGAAAGGRAGAVARRRRRPPDPRDRRRGSRGGCRARQRLPLVPAVPGGRACCAGSGRR